ncbi:MAG TPA: MarR family transcriptional regulator [Clostridiales bacterium UBA8960]|jgi:DNA-binding MarR family transcriptional regulator|nr:MarR family transcriptional regulator [Clostridiales bacterium UBA8960]
MNPQIGQSMDTIGMFCRLNMNTRRELPIRSSEMGVLIYIHKHGAKVTPVMISQFFQIKKPSVTTMLNHLLEEKYLIKNKSETDGRSYTVQMTQKAINLVGESYEAYLKNVEILKKEMGATDFDLFIKLMEQANNALSKESKR